MKGRMFCASQASTAIVDDDDKLSSRAFDRRHNTIINDGRRSSISNKTVEIYKGRRSGVTARKSTSGGAAALLKLITNDLSLARKSFSCVARPASGEFIKTPAGSTRYLLGSDPGSLTGSAGHKCPDGEEIKPSSLLTEEKTSGSGSDQQVVVLKVSLHCRGCEAKVRKHLSRMQGVTSFNIDFAAKKVTVTGDITPLEILDSISKVKNAKFWTAPALPMPNMETPNH
ncbi:unnamed protein product [Eruca vesicaria subsp. sativa]|uniref:HMA domain-containing protein n=1 Tax=Eruca vesicaria subsp. sativa TaxID=29727 RepID=A0ABC8LTT4_ERUVS|nr:unnamed protein product [Eruca vesicaria subsp. sativa]